MNPSDAAQSQEQHQLHIYTGDGKGKTSCAIGLAIRALGAGLRVDWIAFDKGFQDEEHYSERSILRALPGIHFQATGLERVRPGQKFRFGVTPDDRAEVQRAIALAEECLQSKSADMLILDEIISAVACSLLKEKDVMNLIARFKESRPCELVMTGRGATGAMIEAADLVSEIIARKHYFDQGIAARKGIDY